VLKGLPLAYFKDMQEDKEGVFDAAASLALSLGRRGRHGARHAPGRGAPGSGAGAGFATATDLADWLVRELRMPFRDAHHVTGRLVARAEAKGADLAGLTLEEMRAEEPRITGGGVRRADGRGLRRVPHLLRRHGAGERAAHGGRVAGKAGVTRAALALLLLVATLPLLAACGRAGPPRPPGPRGAITYPRVYPAPDPLPPPSTAAPQPGAPARP
jgi:hypothetical protein